MNTFARVLFYGCVFVILVTTTMVAMHYVTKK